MRLALRLARRGHGHTSPNPMVGAVLVKGAAIIGRGWHRRAGLPHAEIEAIENARRIGHDPKGSTLYVTLEPCCTFGRTPPCTAAIVEAGVREVHFAATDPNPAHHGRATRILRRHGVKVETGLCRSQAQELNEYFNHWIVHRTPFVVLKSAMSFDGRIATRTGESKWLTGAKARAHAMDLRRGVDAILVGINTVLADDPALTCRSKNAQDRTPTEARRRIVLDAMARTPLSAQVTSDDYARKTVVVASRSAPARRVRALEKRCEVWIAPTREGKIDLGWLLQRLGQEQLTSLLVEGGGQVLGSFLDRRVAQRIAFFYAPLILGGETAPRAVAGIGVRRVSEALQLEQVRWRKLGSDLLLTARIASPQG